MIARNNVLRLAAGLVIAASMAGQAAASEIFADDFDGDDLAAAWQVITPDPNSYIVEAGELLVITNTASGDDQIADGTFPNIFALDTELPKGDWVMSLKFNVELQTARESLGFGLMDAHDNYVLGYIYTAGDGNYGWSLNAQLKKRSGDKVNKFTRGLAGLGCNVCGPDRQFTNFVDSLKMPIEAQLIKTGRQYTLQAKLADAADWTVVEKLTAIRAPKRPVLFVHQYNKTDGETPFMIDYFRIETVE
jgi:hypothetical protein